MPVVATFPSVTKRPVNWIGSSLKDLKAMPEEVQDEIGFALYFAQTGETIAARST